MYLAAPIDPVSVGLVCLALLGYAVSMAALVLYALRRGRPEDVSAILREGGELLARTLPSGRRGVGRRGAARRASGEEEASSGEE